MHVPEEVGGEAHECDLCWHEKNGLGLTFICLFVITANASMHVPHEVNKKKNALKIPLAPPHSHEGNPVLFSGNPSIR